MVNWSGTQGVTTRDLAQDEDWSGLRLPQIRITFNRVQKKNIQMTLVLSVLGLVLGGLTFKVTGKVSWILGRNWYQRYKNKDQDARTRIISPRDL